MAKRTERWAILLYDGALGTYWYSHKGFQLSIDAATKWLDKDAALGIAEAYNRGRQAVKADATAAKVVKIVKDTDDQGFTFNTWRRA